MAKILIVDDEQQIRRVIELQLTKDGHETTVCKNGQEAIEVLAKEKFDLILTDLQMPKVSGIELLEYIKENKIALHTIVMTAFGSIETAVRAIKLGASDYLTKPLQLAELSLKVENILSKKELIEENKRLKKQLTGKFQLGNIIGKSPAMSQTIEQIKPLANDRNISVLLHGESGTGKELIANAVHFNSPRAEEPFVAINCGALPEHLLESELFGHEKGAFTDAKDTKKGLFETANRGTLFLDEISSMPIEMQVKLLRAIEENEIRRVGGTKNISLDVRFIAASNQDLEKLVREGKFRQDLYYRLAVATVEIPPLQERNGDVRLLTQHFLNKFNQEKGKNVEIDSEVWQILEKYAWEGNVRELENLIELLVVTLQDEKVTKSSLPKKILDSAENQITNFNSNHSDLKKALKQFEKQFISKYLKDNEWNISRTAKNIGISRSALHIKIKDLSIEANKKDDSN